MENVMKIFNLGSLNIDYVYSLPHFVRPGETLSSTELKLFPGGKGLNQSIALAKAGIPVIHGGLIGSDGKMLLDTLSTAGVDTHYIKQVDIQSGHAIIQVDENGQNCIILYAGANHCFDSSYILSVLETAEEGDILLLQNETNALAEIFEIAHNKKMQIAFNPSPYDEDIKSLPLHYVKWWLCNEIEGAELTGKENPYEAIDALSAMYPGSNILLTIGSKGSICYCNGQLIHQPIYKVNAVDTTAAGDTFTGFFLGSIMNGKCPEEALKTAAAASSIAVSRSGASSSIPTLEEVTNFLIDK